MSWAFRAISNEWMTMHPGRPICSPNYFFIAVGNDSLSLFTLLVMLVAAAAHLPVLCLNLKAFSQFWHDHGGLWGINTVICPSLRRSAQGDFPHCACIRKANWTPVVCTLFSPHHWSHLLVPHSFLHLFVLNTTNNGALLLVVKMPPSCFLVWNVSVHADLRL